MGLSVIMDKDGAVTLPPELIKSLGWQPDIVLDVSITPDGEIALTKADIKATVSSC